jgi:hypothetical protein
VAEEGPGREEGLQVMLSVVIDEGALLTCADDLTSLRELGTFGELWKHRCS